MPMMLKAKVRYSLSHFSYMLLGNKYIQHQQMEKVIADAAKTRESYLLLSFSLTVFLSIYLFVFSTCLVSLFYFFCQSLYIDWLCICVNLSFTCMCISWNAKLFLHACELFGIYICSSRNAKSKTLGTAAAESQGIMQETVPRPMWCKVMSLHAAAHLYWSARSDGV